MSGFIEAIKSRVRLYKNDGEPLPLDQAPKEVKSHLNDTENNPHNVQDSQVFTGKDGLITFLDYDAAEHEIVIANGRITSWQIDGDEQLS